MYGSRLRELRESRNLSQSQFVTAFAEKYGDGYQMSQTALSKYEMEQREPKNELLIAFADFFNVTTDYLLGVQTKKDTSLVDEVSALISDCTIEELRNIKKYVNYLRWSREH